MLGSILFEKDIITKIELKEAFAKIYSDMYNDSVLKYGLCTAFINDCHAYVVGKQELECIKYLLDNDFNKQSIIKTLLELKNNSAIKHALLKYLKTICNK